MLIEWRFYVVTKSIKEYVLFKEKNYEKQKKKN